MQARIKNFRGVEDATIEIAPLALVTGLNGQGKTSIARAVAAAASNRAVPFSGLTKKDSGIMLRHGTKNGGVILQSDEGGTKVSWPKGDIETEGTPVVASLIATGLVDFLGMKEDAQLTYLFDLLKAEPTFDDFRDAMEAAEIPVEYAEPIWEAIQKKDWVSAHEQAKTTGTGFKARWSAATGENFGTTKIESWYPQDWNDSMGTKDVAVMEADIAEQKSELEQIIGKSAVSSAETKRLEDLAAGYEDTKKAEDEKKGDLDKAITALAKIDDELKITPNPSAKKDYSCPHCEELVHISAISGNGDYALTKAVKVAEKDIVKARDAYAALCGKQQNAKQAESLARQAFNVAVSATIGAGQAKDSLAKKKPADDSVSAEDVDHAKKKLQDMEFDLRLRKQYEDAKALADKIKTNLKIVDLLDESGIRKTKLASSISAFVNEQISPLCEMMHMPPLSLSVDMKVSVGATPFQMLSGAEQFKARTLIQMGLAKKENAGLLIIDGMDIIVDGKSRGLLLQAVHGLGIPAVICMSLQKADKAPDLRAMGVGATYWMQGGVCHEVSQEIKSAA